MKSLYLYDKWHESYLKKNYNNGYDDLIENDILRYKEEIKFFNREFIYVKILD